MFDDDLDDRARTLLARCREGGLRIATAESCTGGLIAAALTAISGSSDVVERGFVTYTNEAKHEMLGVPMAFFETVGAVSEEVARAMAAGALEHSLADISCAVTGIAGPGGATENKPVGLVHIAAARKGASLAHQRHVFAGDRNAVRRQSVIVAFDMMAALIAKGAPPANNDR